MDFDTGMCVLDTLQNQVGTTKEHKNMIVKDIMGKMIHMVRNVFEKRRIMLDSPHGQSLKGAPQMDEETQNWPIAEELVGELDELKYTFQADLLPLYHDGHLVEPSHAQNVINGAIVEVHFGILHWHISDFNIFQANIEKIIILKLGYRHHTSNYKCLHPNDTVSEPEKKKSCHDEDAHSSGSQV
ncbi:uncharacterized protein BJ212DRAFT_1482686 [Suillus subaureus]|uniref:Uncharacterized protein n=1 Tax=Suillus subaureus TaxID=48587 RepID=A0A9P7E828_9AGAM|nr:uncharacterized protein BJ212DRAFT_1482686 [Suillus subaureus]KAG1813216.1 hypothetical protein BJ212DRAFT_1482686 [Suillus subaureus]